MKDGFENKGKKRKKEQNQIEFLPQNTREPLKTAGCKSLQIIHCFDMDTSLKIHTERFMIFIRRQVGGVSGDYKPRPARRPKRTVTQKITGEALALSFFALCKRKAETRVRGSLLCAELDRILRLGVGNIEIDRIAFQRRCDVGVIRIKRRVTIKASVGS